MPRVPLQAQTEGTRLMGEEEWTWPSQLPGFQPRFSSDPGAVLLPTDYRGLKSQRCCRAPPQARFPDCATAKDPPATAGQSCVSNHRRRSACSRLLGGRTNQHRELTPTFPGFLSRSVWSCWLALLWRRGGFRGLGPGSDLASRDVGGLRTGLAARQGASQSGDHPAAPGGE